VTDSSEEFPEHPLWGRYKWAFDWTRGGLDTLLDAGCAWGYGTQYFTAKAGEVHGLDPNRQAIEVAKRRYPRVHFVVSGLEATPFDDASFDAIVSCDVLEHVEDDLACMSELHRLLRPGGVLVLTVPHAGPLSALDPENWAVTAMIRARTRFPGLYARYKQAVGRERGPGGHAADVPTSEADNPEHRHYSLTSLGVLLDRSAFAGRYKIDRVSRPGFVIEMLVFNVHYILKRIVRGPAKTFMDWAFSRLLIVDWAIPWGPLGNNLAVRIVKER
jgi:SAM-dependent methyltransferase